MTRLLLAYDASEAARAAISVAASLFPGADAVVATVQPPPPSVEAAAIARIALPNAMIRDGVERMRAESVHQAGERVADGAALAKAAGLRASTKVVEALTPWRALRTLAEDVDVVVCGTRGEGAVDRILLGSTASSLLYHAARPLLVVPDVEVVSDGPVLAGYDGSEGAREALRFAAAHLRERPLVVASAWRSPVRHSLRGQALAGSNIGMFEDYAGSIETIWAEVADQTAGAGAGFARELGLTAEPSAPESGRGDARALLDAAKAVHASALLAGSRGRGAVASTVLGSVASALVHAAELPVIVVPRSAENH